jgi:trans-aconitate 2-methyltransferase
VPRDWDADAYDSLPIPMTGWGREVVDRIGLRGDERVLDAGCGTGQVTAHLLDRLPDGAVVALDGSPSMIEAARGRLPADRVTFVVHDLLEPIPIEPVDAIVSTATFHWVPDHERLFANLAHVLRPGGELQAQCGGAGNIENVADAAGELGVDVRRDKTFADPATTEERLRRHGFTEVRCWLTDEPTLVPREQLERYLATVCMGAVIEGIPSAERNRLVHEVAERMDEPRIDYVRLNMTARRRTTE